MIRALPPLAVVALVPLMACGTKAASGSSSAGTPAPSSAVSPAPEQAADTACPAFAVTGDPRASNGATWTYRSTDGGVAYDLQGILFAPAGQGPFAGVVVSHGKGGAPRAYSARIAPAMVRWGLVVIGPEYTHALASDGDTGLPAGADGASPANVSRARKARQLLACLGYVDMTRMAAHGHSMGAFVTGEVLGTYPREFLVASHTAGGTSSQPSAAATHTSTAQNITTPYQLHHGDADQVVALAADQDLAGILGRNGVRSELRVYRGYDHAGIEFDAAMLEAVHAWYVAHGLLP